jgi:alpha-tubulin suppressor-like RCC1 family protein
MFGSRNFLFAKALAADLGVTLWSWGNNFSGTLGRINRANYSSPVNVGTLNDWATPSVGGTGNNNFALCTKTDGTLWSWGDNVFGELGQGNSGSGNNRSSPTQVGALTTWSKPSATGRNTSFCIKTDGTLWAWGNNDNGQAGLGNTTTYSSPKQVGALTTWSKIGQAGEDNILAVTTTGTLFAWGNNNYGQIGDGTTINRSSPVQIGALTNWASPVTGFKDSLCVKTDGTLWAWGRGLSGALGLGNTTNYSSPKQVGALTTWARPSAGNQTSACIKTDGTAWMWGSGGYGGLGQGTTTSFSSPIQVGALASWSYIKIGVSAIAGVQTNKRLFTWGYNNVGQLGLGTSGNNRSSPTQVGALLKWLNPAATNSMMLCTRGGPNGAPANTVAPVISGTAQEDQILVSTTGTWSNDPVSFTFQWQRNTSNISGATGTSYTVQTADVGSTLRCVVTATNAISAVSANSANTATVAAFPSGKFFMWGSSSSGQLGLNNTTTYSSPVQMGSLTTWKRISGPTGHTHAVNSSGELWSWGFNSNGQLGIGNTANFSSPKQVGALTNWKQPAVGTRCSFCVKTDGTLWFLGGSGYYGKSGLGNLNNYVSPKQIGSSTTWAMVTASRVGNDYIQLAVTTDGKLFAWGKNNVGQLGQGNSIYRSSPVQVGALTNWQNPSAGNSHVLCTKTDGTLWAWGKGAEGVLGNGTTGTYNSPIQVGGLTNWATPSAGAMTSLCSKTDGTLWAWGYNKYGELGVGPRFIKYSSPVQVGTLTNWSKPSAGEQFTICSKTDGTLWSWGLNRDGQLGQNNLIYRSSPVQIGALTSWLTVPSGLTASSAGATQT